MSTSPPTVIRSMTAVDLFKLADDAALLKRDADATAIYNALANDPDLEIRTEARFRHGLLLETRHRLPAAAVLYRAILDEKPGAQRVRLELAKVQAEMGDEAAARRTLRQAQAGGLPGDVAQLVDQFQGALRARKPYGGSLEVSLAPSTNINRATRSSTLDTIIAPLTLSDDARAKSGVGGKVAGQAYLRLPIGERLRWTLDASAQGIFYRDSQFDDAAAAVETGVQWTLGRSRLQPQIGRTYRWYGGKTYAVTDVASLNWLRALGTRSQLEASASVGHADYRLNPLETGTIYDFGASLEHAFNARSGGRVSLSGQRQDARDPGYATSGGGMTLLYWFDRGRTTLFTSAGLSHLEADDRLFLFPRRRIEWQGRVSAGATMRQATVHGFAPVVRVSYERNASTVGIYDYGRFGMEVGITRAF